MKAAKAIKYGGPEVVQILEVPTPIVKSNEVLVKIHASSVTPTDCSTRKGSPFIVRFFSGFTSPKLILGTDAAGTIEQIGDEVNGYRVGDEVYLMSSTMGACNAEYIAFPADKVIGRKPRNISFTEATSILDGGLTALVFLRDKAKLKPGQQILINGASGGVGTAAVQLAKLYEAEITAVCSSKNFKLVKSLGADHVIDYTHQDFTKKDKKYDVIFDAVGKSSFSKCKNSLTDEGIYMTTVPRLETLRMLFPQREAGKRYIFAATGLQQNKSNLNYLTQLVEQKKYRPVIDRTYGFDQVAEAHAYVEKGHRSGNVVLKMI